MGYKMDKVENGGSYSTLGLDSFYVICDVCPSIDLDNARGKAFQHNNFAIYYVTGIFCFTCCP